MRILVPIIKVDPTRPGRACCEKSRRDRPVRTVLERRLFECMVSMPKGSCNGPHRGFGLEIARLIADLRDGRIVTSSGENASGVVVTLRYAPGAAA